MSDKNLKNIIGKAFNDIADAIESGQFGEKKRVGITLLGSEHGVDNILKGAELAQSRDNSIEVVLIGPKVDTNLKIVEANTEDEQHKVMEKLLDSKEIDSCVTMHYNFPIGVSTVGRVVTPGIGKEMIIATTTGTSSAHRVEAMVKNALYGIITAKSLGIKDPTVGILNLDGARQVEKALKELNENGYKVNFTESLRADGGAVMRGNDLLTGTPDVMVTDTLTGNLLMKVFSSFNTGGSYEAMGFGYGPGVGEGYDRTILILSRASGVPVVANAIAYAGQVAKGDIKKVSKDEFNAAKSAKLSDILSSLTKEKKKDDDEEVAAPDKEIVTGSVSGIDILDLEDAVKALWKNGVYAESGMGCTGPIVMINEAKVDTAFEILKKEGYVS
ncbi:glycine/sarcosine/betaine reductase complex component C subunit alpha [Tepidibacter hydrothermalis]|uniref:Glycine/sarcosine/betaine reductase complex component C subunit alpha n=1 Tax=Tepidibacter hydrothermalis TaxID=3036126 RepID=A0ABY8EHX6_9FIRM|nr:glycine/sarcosine/betaine reductase complex component C subunit alpha [Tepidibacter hydrothermalis]WFD10455.1 glycine/sarcosine/betaine reductase complex component C subunit alpha [Tepidibacter hydrothermalis]